jgi:hypothetical protein
MCHLWLPHRDAHMSKPLLLEEAETAMDLAARDAERARLAYNEKAKAFREAEVQCQRLRDKWAVVLVDLEDKRQRALKDGNVELAKLLVPQWQCTGNVVIAAASERYCRCKHGLRYTCASTARARRPHTEPVQSVAPNERQTVELAVTTRRAVPRTWPEGEHS